MRTTRVKVGGKFYEMETINKVEYSGFKKRAQEEFYDLLSTKLVQLLCERMLSLEAMRDVLLGRVSKFIDKFKCLLKLTFRHSIQNQIVERLVRRKLKKMRF